MTVPATRPHAMAALLHADRTANEPSCSGPIERSTPVGIVMLASCRTREQRAVSAVAAAHRSRPRAAHLHMLAMSTTCRPSTLVQRRHRTRSRAGRGSPSAPAAERLAHLCSIHPSILGVRRRVLLEAEVGCSSHGSAGWPICYRSWTGTQDTARSVFCVPVKSRAAWWR